MKYFIDEFIGHGNNLNLIQMVCRAIIIFFVALAIIRISGMRSFSNRSAFDIIISIMLGAILSRAIVGAGSFIPTCFAGLTLGIIHRVLALLSVNHDYIGKMIKGRSLLLYEDEIFNRKNMLAAGISKKDIQEEIHQVLHTDQIDVIRKIYMERSGKISIIKK